MPSTTPDRSLRGFTLIELMVVTAILAIIAAIGIPNLLSSRLSANESAAISTLRSIVSAQAQAATRNGVDVDADGRGEHLYLAELSGSVNLRGTAAPLDPAIVSLSLGNVQNSAVNRSGYFYAVFLPDAAGTGVAEDATGGKAAPLAVDADLCEIYWVAYAWPTSFETSGRRAFAANERGTLLQTPNDVQQYEGALAGPGADAAYTAANDMTSGFSMNGNPAPAVDGGLWLPVN
jgi:prepilin-type N-terminal cleavage/methylation domain-containing protein